MCGTGDFGLARRLDDGVELAQTQCGTPLYISPEIANGQPYGAPSDVWRRPTHSALEHHPHHVHLSLGALLTLCVLRARDTQVWGVGVILHQLVTLARPFDATDLLALTRQVSPAVFPLLSLQ